ncbi:MAG TPA: substrate-binding domain-containing protein [Thermoleophilaceae bacterium]
MTSRSARRAALSVLALIVAAIVVSACGSSGSSSSSTSAANTTAATPATNLTASQEIANSGVVNGASFCGTKPITLGVQDGFGVNAWSQESLAAVRSEAAKCKNVKTIVAIGGGDLQKSISDVNSMVAQGAKAITIIPDFGQAELAAIKQATGAGVKVVPWGADPSGTAGTDYVSYVDWNVPASGTLWANWMVKALHGKGNVIFTGGPAGNPVGAEQLAAIVSVFKQHPGMKLLTGDKSWPVTNWDPATAQKVTSALLAKYPKIDGIISNYGTDALASVRAFQAANRKLVPITTLDANGLSCIYQKAGIPLSTISSRNWLGRIAARKAIASAEGVQNTEPNSYPLPFFEDTLGNKPLQCNKSDAPDFYPSNKITTASISQYGKP